jgi:predicted short-subunit dehydrogenase-like oxidoreductase (DUF2520 family)
MHNLNIFIIGSGNIASHMIKAFKANGPGISGIYSRNKAVGQALAHEAGIRWYERLNSIPKTSDVYLICVSDDAIQSVVAQLPKSIQKSKIIAHTSGSKSMEETLSTCTNGGVFYPLQTFSKGREMDYHTIPFCINGRNKTTTTKLIELAEAISEVVQIVDDVQRKRIHLSAVFINNFVNHLIYISENLLSQNHLDPGILQPLLKETILKQQWVGAFDAQTGPARRLDSNTLAAHLEILKDYKAYKAIYTSISKSIQKTYT